MGWDLSNASDHLMNEINLFIPLIMPMSLPHCACLPLFPRMCLCHSWFFAFQHDVLSSLEGCSTGAADFFSGNESSVVFASVGMPSAALHESAEGFSVHCDEPFHGFEQWQD